MTHKPTHPSIANELPTLQRNALAQFLQRRDFCPEDIAQFEYAKIARLPKVGKKGITVIREWLQRHGCDLKEPPLPEGQGRTGHGAQRLDKALHFLEAMGYTVTPPE